MFKRPAQKLIQKLYTPANEKVTSTVGEIVLAIIGHGSDIKEGDLATIPLTSMAKVEEAGQLISWLAQAGIPYDDPNFPEAVTSLEGAKDINKETFIARVKEVLAEGNKENITLRKIWAIYWIALSLRKRKITKIAIGVGVVALVTVVGVGIYCGIKAREEKMIEEACEEDDDCEDEDIDDETFEEEDYELPDYDEEDMPIEEGDLTIIEI